MLGSGVTKDHLAAVVVKNRRHGMHNPDAMFRSEVTADAVLGSRVVSEPLHLWMLCSPNEGAAAVVLRRATPATSTTGGRIEVAAAVLRSHLPGAVLGESTPMAGLTDDSLPTASTLAATEAYEGAGLGPRDLDVVECQDTDAARELMSYEELGLCPTGGAAEMLEAGVTSIGGRLPVNPSGGLLSKGEPLGASALGQVVEVSVSCGATPAPVRSMGRGWVWPTPSAGGQRRRRYPAPELTRPPGPFPAQGPTYSWSRRFGVEAPKGIR